MSTELPAAAKQASERAVLSAIEESKNPSGSAATADAQAPSSSASSSTSSTDSDPETLTRPLKTVFDDQQHFVRPNLPPLGLVETYTVACQQNAVHGLAHRWTLWFDNASKADKAKSWEEQLTKVMTFGSVECAYSLLLQ